MFRAKSSAIVQHADTDVRRMDRADACAAGGRVVTSLHVSRTRQLIAGLREALGSADPLPPPPPVPAIPAPPVRVYSPRPEKNPFAAEAARHTTALVGIGH